MLGMQEQAAHADQLDNHPEDARVQWGEAGVYLTGHGQSHAGRDLVSIALALAEHDGLAPLAVHGQHIHQNAAPGFSRDLQAQHAAGSTTHHSA